MNPLRLQLDACRTNFERVADTLGDVLLNAQIRDDKSEAWTRLYYSRTAKNAHAYLAAEPTKGTVIFPELEALFTAEALLNTARTLYKTDRDSRIAARANGEVAKPVALPSVSYTFSATRTRKGHGIEATVNGEVQTVRLSGGEKYTHVSVQRSEHSGALVAFPHKSIRATEHRCFTLLGVHAL